jgi:hypothetical protein
MDTQELKVFADLLGARLVEGLCKELPLAMLRAYEARAAELQAETSRAGMETLRNNQAFAATLEINEEAHRRHVAQQAKQDAEELAEARARSERLGRIEEEAGRSGLPINMIASLSSVVGKSDSAQGAQE